MNKGMGMMCGVHKLAWVLLFIGGINWGLVAIDPSYNLVDMLLGSGTMAARIIYGLVGLSALAMLGCAKCCMKGGMCSGCAGGSCMGKNCCGEVDKCNGKMKCSGQMKCSGKMEGGNCSGGQTK